MVIGSPFGFCFGLFQILFALMFLLVAGMILVNLVKGLESGDRMELDLSGPEYGLLVEGDKDKLSFQGTRYLGFERT